MEFSVNYEKFCSKRTLCFPIEEKDVRRRKSFSVAVKELRLVEVPPRGSIYLLFFLKQYQALKLNTGNAPCEPSPLFLLFGLITPEPKSYLGFENEKTGSWRSG